jgi:hypothetical protein
MAHDRMNTLSFLYDTFPVRFRERPVDILVGIFSTHSHCLTCLMDGRATRSLEDRGLNGMLVYWLYLPSCMIS